MKNSLKFRFQQKVWILSTMFLISCGTLVGNPEEEDSIGTQTQYKTERIAETPVTDESGEALVLPNKGLSILLTDAPIDGAKSVMITVTELSISQDGAGWTKIVLEEETEIDLLGLQNGSAMILGKLELLPAGKYKEIRLVLSKENPAKMTLNDDTEHELKVPSGTSSGLKIKHEFEIKEGEGTVLVLDFDLRKSIHLAGSDDADIEEASSEKKPEDAGKDGAGKDGEAKAETAKYILRPVLRAVTKEDTGAIEAEAKEGDVACAYAEGTDPDPTSACENAISSSKADKSGYRLGFLPEGTYTVRLHHADGTFEDFSEVIVEKGSKSKLVDDDDDDDDDNDDDNE